MMLDILFFLTFASFIEISHTNKLPIIGVLAQEYPSQSDFILKANSTSFISATYIKYVESAGARVVPVWINQDREYYNNVVQYTNGILLPGGSASFGDRGGYYDAAKAIFKEALQLNENGDYYPILGICLGFEFLAAVTAHNNVQPLTSCSAADTAMPLKFVEDFKSSRLFQKANNFTIKILKEQPVTYNNHRLCVTPTHYATANLEEDWKVLSTNTDNNGTDFISSFEHKRYPFYGVQFHPERNLFDRRLKSNVPHSKDAVVVSQYFSNFFVFECRKNNHKYKSSKEEHDALIYNYNPVFASNPNNMYEQMYHF